MFLRADSTGETTPEADLFLPVIYNEDDLTPDPGTNAKPTSASSQTPNPTNTPTNTPTFTATPTPWCNIQFENEVGSNTPSVLITGDVGIEVTIINLTTNEVLGSGVINGPFTGHDCPGYSFISVSPRIDETNIGHVLLAQQTDNLENNDTTMVVDTSNPVPTSTPNAPYLAVVPDCGMGPDIQFKVKGNNWPVDQMLTLSWEGIPQIVLQANEHSGYFNMTWTFEGLSNGIYTVSALSGTNGISASDQVFVPCGILPTNTPTPTYTPMPTNTPLPSPADLVVGQPILVSTPPIIVYEPVAFQVPITNTGDTAVTSLFFVDLLFDPPATHFSDVYAAVSGLSGNSSVTLTITSTIGLANFVGTHQITGWVDSLDHVSETDETNNLSEPLDVIITEFGGTPTTTPTPDGTEKISGVVSIVEANVLPIERAAVTVIDEGSGLPIASTYSDANGFYSVGNIPSGSTYTVQACIVIDNDEYFGVRFARPAPDLFANIFASQGPCP